MKLNKISTLVGIAVFTMALSSTSLAQVAAGPAGGPPPPIASTAKAKHPLLTALAAVNLTATQKPKIDQIIATRDADNKAFRKAHKGDLPALKAHHKEQERTTMEAIKGVLTTSQWQQLTAMLHHGKKGNKGTPPATPPTAS